jgi:hypothetical protein
VAEVIKPNEQHGEQGKRMNSSHPDMNPPAPRGPAAALVSAMAFALLWLTGCATGNSGNSSPGQRYRCEQGIEFNVKFVDDSALIDSSRGYNVLFRDAGGQGEGQPVYSNAVVRAEFGLGASGREAVLRYPLLPLVARCVQD